MADGNDSPLSGGTHARIRLQVAAQEAKKAEWWYVRAVSDWEKWLVGGLECWGGEELMLKGRSPWPPSASGSEQTFLTSRWGEESLKERAVSCETDCGQILRWELNNSECRRSKCCEAVFGGSVRKRCVTLDLMVYFKLLVHTGVSYCTYIQVQRNSESKDVKLL